MAARKIGTVGKRKAGSKEIAESGSEKGNSTDEDSNPPSNELNAYGIRTARPPESASVSRTERFLSDEEDYGKSPSKRSAASSQRSIFYESEGDRGIRTEQLNNISRTERNLSESDNRLGSPDEFINQGSPSPPLEVVTLMKNLPKKTDDAKKFVSTESRLFVQCPSLDTQASTNDIPNTALKESEVWFPNLDRAYEIIWTNNNAFVKALIIVWFIVSTLIIAKVLVTFINVYSITQIDDCHSANMLCNRFGIACFSRCGADRWNILWYKVFGD